LLRLVDHIKGRRTSYKTSKRVDWLNVTLYSPGWDPPRIYYKINSCLVLLWRQDK